MTDTEKFLARWSRRKRATAPRLRGDSLPPTGSGVDAPKRSAGAAGEGGSPQTEPVEKAPHPDPLPAPRGEGEIPPFDPATLPPLDSIAAGSDIRAFLQVGVPADLTRAALRRAWVTDPAIRDFVGLAENSWDFTAPDSARGFGPLLPIDDVKRLVAEVFGGNAQPADNAPAVTADAATPAAGNQTGAAPPQTAPAEDAPAVKRTDFAVQQDTATQPSEAAPVRRRHGGALAE